MGAHRRRVLVVDDNVDSAQMTAELLRLHGLEVEIASDSFGALALVPMFLPDVALLNIGLPDMDGYELARRIRAIATDCLLIAITGYGTQSDRVRVSAAGFAGHLVKPVRGAAILAAIAGDDAEVGSARQRTADVEFATDDEVDSATPAEDQKRDRGT